MQRVRRITTRKDYRVTLTKDEVLERIRTTCSATTGADVRLERDGSAVICWSLEDTSPAEVWL